MHECATPSTSDRRPGGDRQHAKASGTHHAAFGMEGRGSVTHARFLTYLCARERADACCGI